MCEKTNNKTPYRQKPRTRQLQWHILPNREELILIILKLFQKTEKEGTPFKFTLGSHYHPNTKTRQRHYKKRKLYNIFDTILMQYSSTKY